MYVTFFRALRYAKYCFKILKNNLYSAMTTQEQMNVASEGRGGGFLQAKNCIRVE